MRFPAFARKLLFALEDSGVIVIDEANGMGGHFCILSHLSIYDLVITDGSNR